MEQVVLLSVPGIRVFHLLHLTVERRILKIFCFWFISIYKIPFYKYNYFITNVCAVLVPRNIVRVNSFIYIYISYVLI